MDSHQVYSNHIFLFPFSLKDCGCYSDIILQLVGSGWQRDMFEYNKGNYAENFNLQAYFYEFAAGALLDDGSANSVMESYRKSIGEDASYSISIVGKEMPYTLSLEKVTLNLYDGKVGILGFHLENRKYGELQDILLINDYGRRIYPLYFNLSESGEVDLSEVKERLLADSITISLGSGKECFKEDFNRYQTKSEHPFVLPSYIAGILPRCMQNVHWLQDDRMYVVSWYGDDDTSSNMNLKFSDTELGKAYQGQCENSAYYHDWYRYVFINKGKCSCNSESRFISQLQNATYDRWAERGSLYGVTRYSFVSLTDRRGYNIGRKYVRSMYYYMASLCLAQRTMLLYFSNEISDITKRLGKKKRKGTDIFDEVKRLNLDFIRFMNNIYFREVTTQMQGVELYNIMQKQMEIESDVKEVNSEIEHLYQFANMAGDQWRTKEAQTLNMLAAILMPLTVVTGIFGMNDFYEIYSKLGTWIEISLGIICCIIIYLWISKKR